MSGAAVLRIGWAPARLGERTALRRALRAPNRPRPQAFLDRFENRALVYDCFWHADGKRILLAGPPAMNFMAALRTAAYVALPSGKKLAAVYHPSLSTMTTALSGAPQGTTAVRLELEQERWELPVGANYSAMLAGRRVLFTMSKDNDLAWIREWALWHARLHGTDTIVLFDNGSQNYDVEAVEQELLSVPGLTHIAVPSWPGRFGMTDEVLSVNPFWSHFLQITSMGVVLRRFGAQALGLLNCDIDELAATHSGRPIYDLLADARHGLVVFRGRWIEAIGERANGHRGFGAMLRDERRSLSSPGKWVLDPTRDWVQNLDVHPYWHWVEGRPWFGKSMPRDAYYRHFRGINTNWKESRTVSPAAEAVEIDTDLVDAFGRMAR